MLTIERKTKYNLAGYIIFFLGSLFFALYIQFPANIFANYIENRISQISSNISIRVSSIRPALPFGMKAETININLPDNHDLFFENARFAFQLHSLFTSNKQLKYRADIFNGILSGFAVFDGKNSDNIVLHSIFDNINVNALSLYINLWPCKLSALLNGRADIKFGNGEFKEIQAAINMTNLLIDFSASPLYSIKEFIFSSVQLNVTTPETQLIRIEKLEMKGKQMDISISGTIIPSKQKTESRLNLQSQIILYPLFFMNAGNSSPIGLSRDPSGNTLLSLKIEGTLKNPRISIDQEFKTAGDVKI